MLAVAIYLLLERLGVPRWWSVALALFMSMTPATLLYENFLFYDYPVMVLLVLAALSLHWLAVRPRFCAHPSSLPSPRRSS